MSDPEDLLGKADAFLKRYHPESAAAKHDVPVLTEVITDGRGPQVQAAAPATAQPPVSQAELLELEQRLRQVVLDAIAAQDAHIGDRLKAELELFIRETVARAVATEIARLRGTPRA